MKSKKGIELTMQTIVVAILVLVVLIVSIMLYTRYVNKSANEIDKQFGLMGDIDEDGTINMFDKCPCEKDISTDCKKELKNGECIDKEEK